MQKKRSLAVILAGIVGLSLYQYRRHLIGQALRLRPPRYGVQVQRGIEIPMLDGALLAALRLMRAPSFFFGAASQASVGGYSSAPVVAEIYQPGLAPVGPGPDVVGDVHRLVGRRADLVDDPRFARLADRSAHIDEVYAETARIVATKTTGEWARRLRQTTVPFTVVRSFDELAEDEHLRAAGFWERFEHSSEGGLRLPGVTTRFSATPGGIRRLPPRLPAPP